MQPFPILTSACFDTDEKFYEYELDKKENLSEKHECPVVITPSMLTTNTVVPLDRMVYWMPDPPPWDSSPDTIYFCPYCSEHFWRLAAFEHHVNEECMLPYVGHKIAELHEGTFPGHDVIISYVSWKSNPLRAFMLLRLLAWGVDKERTFNADVLVLAARKHGELKYKIASLVSILIHKDNGHDTIAIPKPPDPDFKTLISCMYTLSTFREHGFVLLLLTVAHQIFEKRYRIRYGRSPGYDESALPEAPWSPAGRNTIYRWIERRYAYAIYTLMIKDNKTEITLIDLHQKAKIPLRFYDTNGKPVYDWENIWKKKWKLNRGSLDATRDGLTYISCKNGDRCTLDIRDEKMKWDPETYAKTLDVSYSQVEEYLSSLKSSQTPPPIPSKQMTLEKISKWTYILEVLKPDDIAWNYIDGCHK